MGQLAFFIQGPKGARQPAILGVTDLGKHSRDIQRLCEAAVEELKRRDETKAVTSPSVKERAAGLQQCVADAGDSGGSGAGGVPPAQPRPVWSAIFWGAVLLKGDLKPHL